MALAVVVAGAHCAVPPARSPRLQLPPWRRRRSHAWRGVPSLPWLPPSKQATEPAFDPPSSPIAARILPGKTLIFARRQDARRGRTTRQLLAGAAPIARARSRCYVQAVRPGAPKACPEKALIEEVVTTGLKRGARSAAQCRDELGRALPGLEAPGSRGYVSPEECRRMVSTVRQSQSQFGAVLEHEADCADLDLALRQRWPESCDDGLCSLVCGCCSRRLCGGPSVGNCRAGRCCRSRPVLLYRVVDSRERLRGLDRELMASG